MVDLELKETGNGGDLVINGNDFNIINSFENMPYIAMFGGNVEQVTPTQRLENEQAFDFWGNTIIEPALRYNSTTEKKMQQVALNSAGRLLVEQAIKDDIAFMSEFCETEVSTTIISDDVLQISIKLIKPDNLENKEFIFTWDSFKGTFIPQPNAAEFITPAPERRRQFLQSSLQRQTIL